MLGSPKPEPGPPLAPGPAPSSPSRRVSPQGGTLRLGDAPHFYRMRLHGAASHGVSPDMSIIIGTCSLAHRLGGRPSVSIIAG